MSELRHIAILAPEKTRRILREVMRLWEYSTPAAARTLRVSPGLLHLVIVHLGLQEEFRRERSSIRVRFADPERK